MRRSFLALIHLGFWLTYLFFLTIILFLASQGQDLDIQGDFGYYASFVVGIAILPPLVSFYANYLYLFPRFLRKRKVGLSVLVGFTLAVGAVLCGFLFIALTSGEALGCIQEGWPYASAITFALSTLFGILSLVLKGFLTWFGELKLKEELMEKNHKMELALVKSQLDPHFLFNTLNNIDVLIIKNPEEASKYLNKLSDIMRFMLYETKTEEIPLAQELEYIEKYIELQKIRTANRNFVQFEVVGQVGQRKVAPMVFIPFIENAFKHSTNKKIDKAVDIDIHIDEAAIRFKCRNRFEAHQLNGRQGLGNELIQKRLNLLYPKRHTLAVERQADHYSVELTILHGAA
ncbi:MAG: histidine kinase [Phaeodactylibacter sp.]|nr:histidine kinase [Phaeodactylibacter sp.]